jgi:hypothetical protein
VIWVIQVIGETQHCMNKVFVFKFSPRLRGETTAGQSE